MFKVTMRAFTATVSIWAIGIIALWSAPQDMVDDRIAQKQDPTIVYRVHVDAAYHLYQDRSAAFTVPVRAARPMANFQSSPENARLNGVHLPTACGSIPGTRHRLVA